MLSGVLPVSACARTRPTGRGKEKGIVVKSSDGKPTLVVYSNSVRSVGDAASTVAHETSHYTDAVSRNGLYMEIWPHFSPKQSTPRSNGPQRLVPSTSRQRSSTSWQRAAGANEPASSICERWTLELHPVTTGPRKGRHGPLFKTGLCQGVDRRVERRRVECCQHVRDQAQSKRRHPAGPAAVRYLNGPHRFELVATGGLLAQW